MAEIVLALVPLLLLLGSLLLGHYPGCDVAMRLADRLASWRRSAVGAAGDWRRPASPAFRPMRGGLLLACGLSGRAPPA